MIDLLVLIHVPKVFIFDIATPKYIPVAIPLNHLEARILEGINHGIIDVCGVIDAEGHEQVLDLLLWVHPSPIRFSRFLGVLRVGEESSRWSLIEDGLQEVDLLIVRLEHTVGKATLFLLKEHLAKRVVDKEVLNLLHGAKVIQVFQLLSTKVALLGYASLFLHDLGKDHPSLVSLIVIGDIRVVLPPWPVVLLLLLIQVH